MKKTDIKTILSFMMLLIMLLSLFACKTATNIEPSSIINDSASSFEENSGSISTYDSSLGYSSIDVNSSTSSTAGTNSNSASTTKKLITSKRPIEDITESEWEGLTPEVEKFFSIPSSEYSINYNDDVLYYINLRKIIDDGKESGLTSKVLRDTMDVLVTIQGIVNRGKPHLYFDYVRNHWDMNVLKGGNGKFYPNPDKFWFDELKKPGEYLAGKTVVEIRSVSKIIELFKNKVNGAVVWDEKVSATANVASTVAGVENLVPIRYETGVGVYDWYVRRHKIFTVKRNLVNLFDGVYRIPETNLGSTGSAKNDAYLWAKYNYLDTKKTNSKLMCNIVDAMPWTNSEPYPDLESLMIVNKDYYIAQKTFFFDLNPVDGNIASDDRGQKPGTDYRTMTKILKQQNENANGELVTYGGFTPWWIKYTNICGEGLPTALELEIKSAELMMPYYMNTDAEAAKAMSNGSVFYKIPLKTLKQNTKNNGQKLENKNYIMLYMGDFDSSAWTNSLIPGFFNDPGKNDVPLSWGVSSLLSNKIPHVFNYMYKNKASNDYFVMANSGTAHFSVEYITKDRPSGLKGTVENWVNLNKRMASLFDLDIGGFLIHDNTDIKSTFDVYSQFVKLGAATTPKIPSTKYNGVPYIASETTSDINTDKNYIVSFIGRRLKPTTDGPTFKQYRCIWTQPTVLAQAAKEIKEMYPLRNVEFVDPYTFFRLYNESLEK